VWGVAVRPIRPGQRTECPIELDGIEQLPVLERRKHLTLQDRTEVDSLMAADVKPKRQRVWSNDLEVLDPM
jgi:hypothetical protein